MKGLLAFALLGFFLACTLQVTRSDELLQEEKADPEEFADQPDNDSPETTSPNEDDLIEEDEIEGLFDDDDVAAITAVLEAAADTEDDDDHSIYEQDYEDEDELDDTR